MLGAERLGRLGEIGTTFVRTAMANGAFPAEGVFAARAAR